MQAVIDSVKLGIDKGVYAPGARLESERALADSFRVPQSQVRKALMKMVEQGYLEVRHGCGYFVRDYCAPIGLVEAVFCTPSPVKEGVDSFGNLLLSLAARERIYFRPAQLSEGDFAAWEETLAQALTDKSCRGAVCSPIFSMQLGQSLLQAYADGFPVLFLDYSPFPEMFPSVGADHFGMGFMAARRLAEAGATRPLFIGYQPEVAHSARMKLLGFENGCKFHQIIPPEPLLISNTELTEFPQILKAWMQNDEFDFLHASTGGFTRRTAGVLMADSLSEKNKARLLGVDAPQPLPGSGLNVDCIMRDREGEARAALEMFRKMLTTVGRRAPESVRVPPRYLQGNTLMKG